jgi:hypothetical protein
MPERTAGGLFLPDAEALAMKSGEMPPFAKPVEPTGDGLVIEAGFSSSYLITDAENWWAELDRPSVLIAERALDVADLIAPLEAAAQAARPIAIVAFGVSPEARAFVVINKLRGFFTATVVETTRTAEVASYLGSDQARRVVSGVHTTLFVR